MTRQQAVAAAPLSRRGYWINIAVWSALASIIAAVVITIPVWKDGLTAVWPVYLLSALLVLTLLQSAERLAFPIRTALRSRALNIKAGPQVFRISKGLYVAMLATGALMLAYTFVRNNHPPGSSQPAHHIRLPAIGLHPRSAGP